ncbi:MAG: glycosyltransferase family 9 protein [Bacteroidota bacterium]|nr:glycosyltransferase family 9 protein [Bacteroidota bacterium]MDP4229370.1 glycosyltransferase family 9 protein [Bacteroidota bacterium]MDP4235198.1 glycosyltransferase family 9 protein [Bacteroidota bacterium]
MSGSALLIHDDCRHFRGDIPCKPNKEFGVHCDGCEYYDKITENILIIKLGAAGDVLRTTPILHTLKAQHPHARIWWLTLSPELVPTSHVDKILKWNTENLEILSALKFSLLFNLDKDHHACALANRLEAKKKIGFLLSRLGVSMPADKNALEKYETGIFDDVSIANRKSYPEELFEVCGYKFAGEKYILDAPADINFPGLDSSRPIVGMNTGAGIRWTSRLWSTGHWAELAKKLHAKGFNVLLLGGPDEDARNKEIQDLSGGTAQYIGYFPLTIFISLVNKCSTIISGVTMAFHIAVALEKKIVLINNIFNKYEFGDLYGLGTVVEPDKPCICYFRGTCINKEYFCLEHLPVEKVLQAVL